MARSLFEDAYDIVWFVDKSYTFLYGNKTFLRYLGNVTRNGLQPGESIFFPGIPDASREKWKAFYDRILSDGMPFAVETESFYHQQPVVFGYSFSLLVPEQDDDPVIMVIGRELNLNRELEGSLARVNDLLDITQNLAHVGGWEWNVGKEVMTWTRETFRIHDLDPESGPASGSRLIETSLSCYLPEDREKIRNAFTRCCEEGIPYEAEYPMITVTGRHIWIKTLGNAIMQDGRVVKVYGNIIDITENKIRDQKLKESEEKFRAITQQCAEMLFLHDLSGRIVDVNQAAVRQTGFSKEELLQMSVFDIDPDAAERSDPENIWDELKFSESRRFEVRHRRKDGTIYPAEVNAGKIFFGDREYILAMVKDLTAQKEAFQTLRNSEQRANALVAAIPDIIFRMNSGGVFLSYKGDRQQLLVEPERFIGKSASEILPEWLAGLALEKIEEALGSGKIQVFEYKHTDTAGTEQFYECRMVPDAETEVVAIVRNITEAKESQKKLAASEAKFRTLFENLSQGIFYQAADGKVVDANDAVLKLFGLTRAQFLGKDSYDERWRVIDELNNVIPPERHPSMVALKTGLPVENITIGVFIPESGIYQWLIANAIPQFRNGEEKPFQVFVSFQDITERKKAEEELFRNEQRLFELNLTKDKFFSIIAHDLKNPFNAILGFSDLLVGQLSDHSDSEAKRYAGIIQDSSQRLIALLNNLLDWARAQTGKMEFNPEYLEVSGLIQDNIQLMSDIAREKSIGLVAVVDRKNLVMADRNMINGVMRNLISNAIKFSHKGGEVTVSTRSTVTDQVFTVTDHGVGIDRQCLDRLFRIGECSSTKGTMNERGSGLGLILCKEFVDKHRGRIWVESEQGKGSSFSFSLPLENGVR